MTASSRFVDLSQTFADGMPGIPSRQADGSWAEATVRLRVTRTREESAIVNRGKSAFERTEVTFPTAIATYIDAPYCRYAEKRDISELRLDDVILPGFVVDCRGVADREAVTADKLPKGRSLAGHAVLFNFGWDKHWGSERFGAHPHVAVDVVDRLIADGAKLLGVDTGNPDARGDLGFPVHSQLLARDILICENLTGLDALIGRAFRFFAVPIKAVRATSMTVRAFAELL
jgi:kynurenine formamidase